MSQTFIHESAVVHPSATVGEGSKVWINVQVRENAHIGAGCILSKDVYIDAHVTVGERCKVQNGVSL